MTPTLEVYQLELHRYWLGRWMADGTVRTAGISANLSPDNGKYAKNNVRPLSTALNLLKKAEPADGAPVIWPTGLAQNADKEHLKRTSGGMGTVELRAALREQLEQRKKKNAAVREKVKA